MLPIFGFLLYVVAMFIATRIYKFRSGLHEVPLAIMGPSHLLLDSSIHPSPGPENANYTAGEWLLLLGSVVFLITLVSLWFMIIWVSVAHPSFLDEVYDKCFISTVDTDDAPWCEQETRNPEEDYLNALKEKDATISLNGEKILKLESEFRDLQASSTRQLEVAKSSAAEKQNIIEADNAALRATLNELELSHQAASLEQDKKLALMKEDILKSSASSTRQLEEAKLAAAKKQDSIDADNAALRVTLRELEFSQQAFIIEQNKKLASKEEDLLKLRASLTRQLEKAKSAAAEKQNSIEAENAALRETLHELELSHQAFIIEQDKKLASKDEDLLEICASSKRQLEEAKLAAAENQNSIEAENAALRVTLQELELSHRAFIIEQDKKLASKEEDLLRICASSTHQLEEAKLAAAKKQNSIEVNNAALRVTLHELELSHQAASIEQDKKLASKEEDLLILSASSTRQLEEAKSTAAKIQDSIETNNTALRVTLHELELSHQAFSAEQDKKLALKDRDLLKLRASSTRQLEEAKSSAAEKRKFIEAENAALCVTLHELELSHQALSIEQNKKLASKEEDLLKLSASSIRQLEEAKSAAAEKQIYIEADNAALRATLHELELGHQVEQDKKLALKDGDFLKLRASSIRQLEELAKSAAAEKQNSIETENAALRVTLHELELSHQAFSIEQDQKLASKEEDLLKICANSTRHLEEAISTAAKRHNATKADNAALRVTLHELELSHQAASIEQDKKLASKEEDCLKFEQGMDPRLAFLAEREIEVAKLHSQEMVHIIDKHAKGSNLHNVYDASILKLLGAGEAETRYCTEYLLFAETGSPKVRLPNKA